MKRVPPWLIFTGVGALAAGLRVAGLVPPGAPLPGLQIAGAAIGVAGIGLGAWSVKALLGYDGEHPVTEGPFRFSRHPMYLAMLAVVVAAGLITAEWVVLGAAAAFAVALDRLVIVPEEIELLEVFAEEYAAYQRRVRRWL